MRELKYKVGDKFRVVEERLDYKIGEIFTLTRVEPGDTIYPYLLGDDIWVTENLSYWNDSPIPFAEPINNPVESITSNILIQIL
jgi:hypothetical protein